MRGSALLLTFATLFLINKKNLLIFFCMEEGGNLFKMSVIFETKQRNKMNKMKTNNNNTIRAICYYHTISTDIEPDSHDKLTIINKFAIFISKKNIILLICLIKFVLTPNFSFL